MPPRVRRIQAGQPVANLLEAGAESPPQKVEVIPELPCRLEEAVIWHHHRCREISGERRAEQGPRAVILQPVGLGQVGDEPGLAKQGKLDKQVENPLRAPQGLAEQDFPAVIVIATQLRAHDAHRQNADTEPRIGSRMLDQAFQNAAIVLRSADHLLPELLGSGFCLGEIVVRLLQHVTDPFDRVVDAACSAPVAGIH